MKKFIEIMCGTASNGRHFAGLCFPLAILLVVGGFIAEMIPGGQDRPLLTSLVIAFALVSMAYLQFSAELWDEAEKVKKMRARSESLRELEKRADQARREMEQEEA